MEKNRKVLIVASLLLLMLIPLLKREEIKFEITDIKVE
jgi:hypothetical protein